MTLDVRELSRLIAAAPGVDWTPEETSIAKRVSHLGITPSTMFGLAIEADEIQDIKKRADAAQRGFQVGILPERVDWRQHKGASWLPPVRDQGACGACVAFSTVATLETRVKLDRGDADLNIALSEAHLFFCGVDNACTHGWNFEAALKHCETVGVARAEDAPYTPVNQDCALARSVVRVTGWDILSARRARMSAIASGGPVIAGMRVFEDFYYYKSGIYRHVTGEFQGLHAVCVVGYDENRQCWIARNSWGADWGEDGYVEIAYGDCGIDNEFVFFAPDVKYDPGGYD